MLLFKFLPEARISWRSQSENLIELVIGIWGVSVFCNSCIMIKNIFDKVKGLCRKGNSLRQIAPNTSTSIIVPTLNTIGRASKRKTEY